MANDPAGIAIPVEKIVDFEKLLDELENMLPQGTEKRLMFVSEQNGKGKSCLLRKMEANCMAKEVPCCLIEFQNGPYDAPYLTLAREICELLKVAPRHLAEALRPLGVASANTGGAITTIKGDVSESTVITQIVNKFTFSEKMLNEGSVKRRLKRAFAQDIRTLDKTAVVLIDDLEESSLIEKQWLVEALLQPVQAKEIKNIIIVTAGTDWPKIDTMQWKPYAHFIKGLPMMQKKHMKEYAIKVGYPLTEEELEVLWPFTSNGHPFAMGFLFQNRKAVG